MFIQTEDGALLLLSEIAVIGRLHKSGTYDVILKSGLELEFCNEEFGNAGEDVIIKRTILVSAWIKSLS